MIEYYNKRINELNKQAKSLELKAEREMRDGSGAQAMEYCRQADAAKVEAAKWREALKGLEKVA